MFSADYRLLGLDELRCYLENNKHLPGVPSEKEILESGYDINEMQYLMLEKIEEMTRYILLLQDEINLLKLKQPSNDSIRFSYDANGNRISRSLTFKRITNQEQDQTVIEEVAYKLFPNPTSDQFSIIPNEQPKESPIRATLLTVSGVILEEKEVLDNSASFNLSGMPNGIYILEIDSPEGHQTWKVVKQ